MNGSALLRSAAFNETKDCCWVVEGAKAEADAERRARIAADFIIFFIVTEVTFLAQDEFEEEDD